MSAAPTLAKRSYAAAAAAGLGASDGMAAALSAAVAWGDLMVPHIAAVDTILATEGAHTDHQDDDDGGVSVGGDEIVTGVAANGTVGAKDGTVDTVDTVGTGGTVDTVSTVDTGGNAVARARADALTRNAAHALAAARVFSPVPLAQAAASFLPPFPARVYYNRQWVRAADVPRYLTDVPAACGRGGLGAPLLLQAGATLPDAAVTWLLSADDRVRARKKVVATWDWLVAVGSARARTVLPCPQFCVILHAAVCQMDHPHLEPRLFVVAADDSRVAAEHARAAAKGRRPTMVPLWPRRGGGTGGAGGGEGSDSSGAEPRLYLDCGAYRASVAEDIMLLLCAFEAEVAAVNASFGAVPPRRGLLKLPAMGLGPHVALADGTVVGTHMFAPFLLGVRDALCSRAAWPWLAAIELPDFTASGAFTPRWPASTVPVSLVTGVYSCRDLLDFTAHEASTYVCGVVSPGSAYALPGNGPTPASLETVVADNTTQRRSAWYMHNPSLLDAANHVAVDTTFRGKGQAKWWPPSAWLLPPL